MLYEIIIFFCVLGGRRKQGRDGNTIDNGRGLTSFIIIAAGSYLSAVFASLIPQIPAALQGIQSALTVYGSLKKYITSNLCRRSCKLYNPEIYYKIVKNTEAE